MDNGLGILDNENFGNNLEMSHVLVEVEISYALTMVTNSNEIPVTLYLNEPLEIEQINIAGINFIEKKSSNIS